ncbi:hypothetical protein QWY75_08520 [Pontixanthobacter aestiaquae]|uniref:Uncharacterized protein n=1 Tax=Pontixanthobacter aestiaquae TaxID=1509367 RepID=A0A844Z4C2_9SPHN|nr:hypothetical protein [Pontixanthobacter aestiaquae]MDN3646243.1 hypothetical protein [Pontixanthobacter aestiaquae]MXO82765.1 hypothetical protein [Pontixanthobacter aestiaquae]
MKALFAAIAMTAILGAPTTAAASNSEAEDALRLICECAYVVRIAEGNGVKLRNSSAIWSQAKATVAEKTGLSTREYDELARAKWERRLRNLGARDAMRRIADRARDCDKQL